MPMGADQSATVPKLLTVFHTCAGNQGFVRPLLGGVYEQTEAEQSRMRQHPRDQGVDSRRRLEPE